MLAYSLISSFIREPTKRGSLYLDLKSLHDYDNNLLSNDCPSVRAHIQQDNPQQNNNCWITLNLKGCVNLFAIP